MKGGIRVSDLQQEIYDIEDQIDGLRTKLDDLYDAQEAEEVDEAPSSVEDTLPESLTDYFFDHGKEIELGNLDAGWIGFVVHRGDDSFILVDSVNDMTSLLKRED